MSRLLPSLWLLCGCLERAPEAPVSVDARPAPTGVAKAGAFVVVLDSGAVYGTETTYRPGSVVVIDPSTFAIVNRLPTTGKDPVYALATATDLYVVSPGPIQGPEHAIAEDGALDVFPVEDLDTAVTPAWSVRFKGGGKPALIQGRLFLGSATTGDVFEVDLLARKLARTIPVCTPHDLNTTAVAAHSAGLLVACCNSDDLHVLDPVTGAVTEGPIDLNQDGSKGQLQCPIDLTVREDGQQPDVFVVMAIAPLIAAVDARTWTVAARWFVGGVIDNRLACEPDRVYVTSSGDNALRVLDRATASETARVVFPPKCAPWETAIAFGRAWVSLNGCGKVGAIDIEDPSHVMFIDL